MINMLQLPYVYRMAGCKGVADVTFNICPHINPLRFQTFTSYSREPFFVKYYLKIMVLIFSAIGCIIPDFKHTKI